MNLSLTRNEAVVLKFFLEKALIDAEGMAAIGIGSEKTVQNLKNIKRKLSEEELREAV